MTYNGVIYQIGDRITLSRPELFANPMADHPYSTVDHICTQEWVIAQFYGSEGFIPYYPVMITCELDEDDEEWLPDAFIPFSNIASGGFNVSSYCIVHYTSDGSPTNMPEDQTKLLQTPLILYSNVPQREGYDFAGWENRDEPIDTEHYQIYQPGDMYTLDRNATFLAVWKQRSLSVMYNKNSGSDKVEFLPDKDVAYYGDTYTINKTLPTRYGYRFAGYATSVYGDVSYPASQIENGLSFPIYSSLVLYCIWERASYLVEYSNKANAIAFPENQEKIHGINLVLSNIRPTRPGFEFLRWEGELLGTTVTYQPGSVYSADNAITLNAIWTTKNYYIFYYYNGGTTGPNTQIKISGNVIELSSVIPVKEGCRFLGWAIREDGDVVYQPGDLYTEDASINLYAQWEQYSFTISYDPNVPEGVTATVKNMPEDGIKLYWGTYIIPDVTPTLSNYTFTGWATEPDGEIQYNIGSILKSERSNLILYAVWAINTHILSFEPGTTDPVTDLPAPIRVAHGGNTILPNVIPQRAGYQFLYYTADTGSALVQYHAGVGVSDILQDIVFTAQWKPSFQITYVIDYDDYNEEIIDWKDEGVDYSIIGTIPHKEGFTFLGWALEPNGSVTYTAGDYYRVDAPLTLYSVWEIEMIYIIYDMDGDYEIGQPLPPYLQRKQYGETITLYDQPPIETPGYDFLGWQLEKDSSNIDYPVGQVNKYSDDSKRYVILYPVLTAIMYEIRYHKNTDTGITPGVLYLPDNTVCGYHETYQIPVTRPVRDGYIFRGYSYVNTYSENGLIPAGSEILIEKSIDLYCIWDPEQYIYTFQWYGKNNLLAIYRESVKYGIEYTFPENLPTDIPEGKLFNGWSIVDGGEVMYQPGHKILPKYDCTFYASLSHMTYVVVYMANGGEYAPMTQQKLYGVDLTLSMEYPIREGYSFEGWAIIPNGEVVYQKDIEYVYRENNSLILYAVWKEKTFTVLYDANTGYAEPTPQVKKEGIPIQLTNQKPMKDGYRFIGWSTTRDSQIVAYSPGDMYTLDMDITLYAIWEILVYDITYDIYGENADVWSDTKRYNEDYKIRTTAPTWTGHTFLGWSTTAYQGKVEYMPGDIYTINKDLFLFSVFEAFSYTIRYHSDGIVSLPNSQTKYYGTDIFLNGMIPYRSGYGFVGYGTTPDATEAEYFPGDLVTVNENLDLYAIWKANEYIVSYNANGGTGAPSPQRKFHDAKLELSDQVPVRTGYTFLGWGLNKETVSYKPGWSYTMNATVVLYAIWAPMYYDVDYLLNGGVMNAPTHQSKKHDENLILYSEEPEKEGYDFLGWAIVPDSTEVVYKSGDLYTKNESVILYAVYSPKPYTITFESLGYNVTNLPNPMTKYYGQDIILPNKIPYREYYGFLGWTTKKIDTGTEEDVEYENGATYSKNESVTLYPVWVRLVYRYSYNANGGTEAPMTQWKQAGIPMEITMYIPIRLGYTFKGWSRSPLITQIAYMPGDITVEDADITLYAVWELTTYTIHFDANGGYGAPADITKYYGMQVFIPLVAPRRDGYVFLGWALDPSTHYPAFYPGELFTMEGNVTLYAVWDNIDLWKRNVEMFVMDNDYIWREVKTTTYVDEETTVQKITEVFARPVDE